MLTAALLAWIAVVAGGTALRAHERRSPNAKMRRQLKETARVKIGEFPESQVACTIGRTRQLEQTHMLEAPLTGRPCLFYIAEVEVQAGRAWRLIARERSDSPFI